MSHRDRKDYRRRDPGLDTGHSSSRRGLGSGRERERPRRSRSRSPRERQKSKEHDSDPRRKEDRRVHGPERKGDDKRDRRRDSRERETRRDERSSMKEQPEEKMAVDAKVPIVAEDVTEEDMMAMMGFSGFSSTKGQAVEGNQEGAVKINKQRTWRQYMNRKGGFNRPLEKVK